MKKCKLTKVIASSLIVASALAIKPVCANAEWLKDSTGWWYAENSSWATGWKQIDGQWYYFNSDGYMVHDTTVEGYKLGSSGAWIQEVVLATIGDQKITKDDLDKELAKYDSQLKQQYGDDYKTKESIKDQIKQIKKDQLNNIVIEKILLKKADDLKLKPADAELNQQVSEQIAAYKQKFSQSGQFESILKQSGVTEDQLKQIVRDSIIAATVQADMIKDVKVEDSEIQAYYDKNKDTQFKIEAGGTVSHILVKDEATAKKLRSKIMAGTDFAEAAKENSLDPGSKDNGGSLGYIKYSETNLVPEFIAAVKKLKEGEVSQPVKSQYGYHLIKITGIKKDGIATLDEVKDQIKQGLLPEKQTNAFSTKLEQWKKELNVKTFEDKIN